MMPRLQAMELKNLANAVAYGSGNMEDPEAWAQEMDRRRFGAEPPKPVRVSAPQELAQMMAQGPPGMNMVLED